MYMRGGLNYYGIADMKNNIESLNGWLYRRIRMYIWKQWKLPKTRRRKLKGLGLPEWAACEGLARGFNYSASVRSLSNAMMSDGRIYTPDISKLLDYLVSAGYVRFTDKKINSYTAYRNDAVVQLTKEGIDLVEATIEDPGVDI